MRLSGYESGSESNIRLLRMKDGCFGGVIAMDVRGVGLKALGNGSLYIYNFLEDDFGGGLPAF